MLSDIELVNYFANHHQIHGFLYDDSGNRDLAAKEMEKFNMMKQVVGKLPAAFGPVGSDT